MLFELMSIWLVLIEPLLLGKATWREAVSGDFFFTIVAPKILGQEKLFCKIIFHYQVRNFNETIFC